MKKERKEETVFIGEKYEVCGRLGQGGGGQVYRVYDRRLDKYWAAKRVRKDCPGMEDRVLGRVSQGAFPRIVDIVEEENSRVLIMDWIEGETLQKKLERTGAFSVGETVQTGIALCDALCILHTMQPPLLYLDCKPSNIMADKEGKLWLIDFGSAVAYEQDSAEPIAASFGFAAPEQMKRRKEDRRVDVRTDVFGLGRTLYALLTARDLTRPPYAACRLQDCNAGIPDKLAGIVERCVEERPEERFQTIWAVKEALQEFAASEKRKHSLRRLFPAVTLLLLGMTIWQACLFYKEVSAVQMDQNRALWSLARMLFFAGNAALWQRLSAERIPKAAYEPLQSVLRTEKKPGRWLFLLLAGMLLLPALPGQALARESENRKEGFPLILRDHRMRKLLVKEGTVLETAEKLYLELDPVSFVPGKEVEIRMTVRETESGWTSEYRLRYCPRE